MSAIRQATVRLDFAERLGPLHVNRMGLGQGGLSPEPMWADRAAEIRALRPRLIRFWAQQYHDPLPRLGEYHFDAADRAIAPVLAAGATPLISLNFKPPALFPRTDERIIEPADWAAWEELVYRYARHYAESGLTGWYWEIIGESDCGEGGGCAYLVTPENYPPFYRRTAAAILMADPSARVGGPGLGFVRSPILPAWLDDCAAHGAPLHFVSWHIYSSDPPVIGETVAYVREQLARRPTLRAETILDEWNMSLWPDARSRDPRFQPCFIAETAWQMIEAGLDASCYYQIRDYHVEQSEFARFFSPQGAAFMARWWNRMPQWDGLFDFQNTPRPSYFAFKLLSRLAGERLAATSDDPAVHALLSHDANYQLYNVLFWNYAPEPVRVTLWLDHPPTGLMALPIALDAEGASNDENRRLRPADPISLDGRDELTFDCAPYAVHFAYLLSHHWTI